MGYLFLAGAICTELIGTLSLRASEGFSKPGYIVIVVAGYVTAFVFLGFALDHGLTVSIAYGIWAAAGIALVAILSVPIFGDSLSAGQIVGLMLVIAGVFVLETSGHH